MKELRISLDYMASTYGIGLLVTASLEYDDDGSITLIIKGEKEAE